MKNSGDDFADLVNPDMQDPKLVRALIQALSGLDFEMQDFDAAIDQLDDAKQVAETVFDKVATQIETERLGEIKRKEEQEQELKDQLLQQQDREVQLMQEMEELRQKNELLKQQQDPGHTQEAPDEDVEATPYEVVLPAVWVRAEANEEATAIAKCTKGHRVEVLGYNDTMTWGRVVLTRRGQLVKGWMKLDDEEHGQLLKPAL